MKNDIRSRITSTIVSTITTIPTIAEAVLPPKIPQITRPIVTIISRMITVSTVFHVLAALSDNAELRLAPPNNTW